MSASPEKCVNGILKEITETFQGLDEEHVREFEKIMIKRVRSFAETLRKEATAAANGEEELKAPRVPRVTGYTLYGNYFREQKKGEIPAKEMFKSIGASWKDLGDSVRSEWTEKAKTENERLREEYIKEHGSLPVKGKKQTKAKRTNGFQQFVSEFRSKNRTKVAHNEMFSKAGEKWRAMKPAQKKKYEDKAAQQNESFAAEWERMKEEDPSLAELEASRKGKKKKKNPDEPTPAGTVTGYRLYGDYWRSKLNSENLVGKDAMRSIGASWRQLAAKDQTKYRGQADKQNEGIISSFLKEHGDSKWAVNYQKRQEKTA